MPRSHDVGADPGDERFPNRTTPATLHDRPITERTAREEACNIVRLHMQIRFRPFRHRDPAEPPSSVSLGGRMSPMQLGAAGRERWNRRGSTCGRTFDTEEDHSDAAARAL